ncbi:MAG TPA: SpoIIE family protein phosphatase [Anaerolineaceae bacterium]|nr:SpoIIE family protein phosphatase [Anaerolineaceae bacterium]
MLRLKNFVDFPQLDAVSSELAACRSGMIVVSGMDPRPEVIENLEDRVLPSGRNTIYGVLVQEILTTQPNLSAAILVRDEDSFRPPRSLRSRIDLHYIESQQSYVGAVAEVKNQGVDLVGFDRLDRSTIPLALGLVQQKCMVIGQLDSILWGEQILRYLTDFEPKANIAGIISWVLSVQRIPTLCSHCKTEDAQARDQFTRLQVRFPQLFEEGKVFKHPGEVHLYQAAGCRYCHGTGRLGDAMLLDVFRVSPLGTFETVASLEDCVAHQITQGVLAADDLLGLEKDLLRRTNHLLLAREQALSQTEMSLNARLAEIEASNRVLHHRTEEFISLFDVSQAMMASVDIDSLARRICQKASSLFSADRIVLYLIEWGKFGTSQAEILGCVGWGEDVLRQKMDLPEEFGPREKKEPESYRKTPPGLAGRSRKNEGEGIKAGVKIPLMALDKLVGWMVIQSTQKKFFSPGEITLLQTLSSQAAMAIQRASLIEDLKGKIIQLEQAQEELVKKERIERELELARQVQQSLLPKIFPSVGKFSFSALGMPARQMGGDFYDVIQLDEDHQGVVIADVSDKGMPAALYMALSRSLILAEAHRTVSPRDTLLQVNHLLLELAESPQFVAVFYGVIEQSTDKMVYARAGHERPLILRKGQIIPLAGRGTVLGMLNESEVNLSEEEIFLLPGDRLVCYTDGLVDAVNTNGEFFGVDRFLEAVKSCQHLPLNEIGLRLIEEISRFQGSAPQFDDMTLLLVELKPD